MAKSKVEVVLRNSRASDRGFAVGAMCEQDVSRVRQKEGAGGWWGQFLAGTS